MYSCSLCFRTFSKRSSYESHQARVRPCRTEVSTANTSLGTSLDTSLDTGLDTALNTSLDTSLGTSFGTTLEPVKPVIKWVGGKTQILSEILERFPRTCRNYYEPFLGGGSVLLGVLAAIRAGTLQLNGTLYASDINPSIIGLYQTIQRDPDTLLAELRILMTEFSECTGTHGNRSPTTHEEAMTSRESYYYWTRSLFNQLTSQEKQGPRGASLFLFLNKTCFRGVYRESANGFNVPYGHNKNPGIADETHLRTVSEWIQPVVFRVASFADVLGSAQSGDMVYLDPPYVPETATSFVTYTAGGFCHHKTLFDQCHAMTERGVSWLMSNADVPLVRTSFPPPYTTSVILCRRAIHSKRPDSTTNEVLIQRGETGRENLV